MTEDEKKCNTHNCLSLQGDKNEKEKKKEGLMYICLPWMHMLSFGTTSFATLFQHLPQHHFNTISVVLFYVTLFQHCLLEHCFDTASML
jgi:hypothetical protein